MRSHKASTEPRGFDTSSAPYTGGALHLLDHSLVSCKVAPEILCRWCDPVIKTTDCAWFFSDRIIILLVITLTASMDEKACRLHAEQHGRKGQLNFSSSQVGRTVEMTAQATPWPRMRTGVYSRK